MDNEQQHSDLNSFPQEVIDKLDYYVYELIDPRNGQVFYIGKGKGNRVFDHVKCAFKGNKLFSADQDDEVNLKIKQINEILNAGLQVIYIIVRWGLERKAALEVEAALMDVTPGLTNIQNGYNAYRGITDIKSLINSLSADEYVEPVFKYMIIKTTQKKINECYGDIYKATRYCWKVDAKKANKCDCVFSVVQGLVMAVYENPKWKPVSTMEDRYEFDAVKAPENIWNQYVGKRIPSQYRKRGSSNPILYKQ